ncbi:sugar ABC transporter ATP-binding protein [Bacteroides sp. 214]|uniref:sugar ABC transporter ATP-binding protein n=1 Tax=Bacteroides sp. 214 TaxID=2302935 RepID=UPI0013D390AC|nr:sugar ABC transporter ATP-binding protein [Bacteroides sp. 214]NDW13624.1 sugar ABC transporter ATP-binding protein [Bacteroides sp. 214]
MNQSAERPHTCPSTPQPLVKARRITKRWPGVVALDGVDFNIYAGKVNAIVGENGAGKSTLMNIISGTYSEYEGDVLLDDVKVCFRNTSEAARCGISMIHQELNLVPHLSIAENIYLGREPVNRLGLIDYRKMHADAALILNRFKFTEDTHKLVSELRVGQQQIVEIAKALAFDIKVLIMDEPTSSLSENETQILFEQIEELTSKGVGIVYITHKMDELRRLANFVTVLRDGKFIGEYKADGVSTDEIIRLMVGRDRKDLFVKRKHPKGEKALELINFSMRDTENKNRYKVKDVNLHVAAGEVLGIYGLMGAGRSELFEAIFGVHKQLCSGQIRVSGKNITIKSPKDAIKNGIALIPEDRKNDGLVLGMDIGCNISLASIKHVLKFGFLHYPSEEAVAESFREKLSIKSHSCRQIVGNLSGGNQQKVVLSKWLLTNPKVLLLDEPTRGIDINAKNEIYKLIDELAARSLAVVVVSSELPEIMAISDRIITICNGCITGEFTSDQFTEEAILKASLPCHQS